MELGKLGGRKLAIVVHVEGGEEGLEVLEFQAPIAVHIEGSTKPVTRFRTAFGGGLGTIRGGSEEVLEALRVDYPFIVGFDLSQETLPFGGVHGPVHIGVGHPTEDCSPHGGSAPTSAASLCRLLVFGELAIAVLVEAGELFVGPGIELGAADGAVLVLILGPGSWGLSEEGGRGVVFSVW